MPAWTAENTAGSAWTRYLDGAGGMAASIDQANVVTYQLTNVRGDVIATAGVDPAGPTLLSIANTDEYGQNRTTNPLRRYQYVGTAQRWTDTATNIILMGARLYQPATGRFLQVDPVEGGSANRYDYVNGDPVNRTDPSGECWWCRKHVRNAARRAARWTGRHWGLPRDRLTLLVPVRRARRGCLDAEEVPAGVQA